MRIDDLPNDTFIIISIAVYLVCVNYPYITIITDTKLILYYYYYNGPKICIFFSFPSTCDNGIVCHSRAPGQLLNRRRRLVI